MSKVYGWAANVVVGEFGGEIIGRMRVSDEAIHLGSLRLSVIRPLRPLRPRETEPAPYVKIDAIELRVVERFQARGRGCRIEVVIPEGLTPVTGPHEFLTIVRACDVIRPDLATTISWICGMIEAGVYA